MESIGMPGESRMERKKKKTRQKIIEVAMDLFQRQGFGNTTMEQIAEAADIARKTLYNHFPVKEAIVDEYVKVISMGLAQETLDNLQNLPDTGTRLIAALDKAYAWVETNPEITGICLGYRLKCMSLGSGDCSGETGTKIMMTEIIRQGQQAGEIRQDLSVELMVEQLNISRCVIVLNWLKDPSRFELRKEMAKMVDLFIYGAIKR
ncbi:MAG TPA: TetR/AcrR family transcriptional regulator [Desulfotomaculum sp.]|nr:MAG: Transcriptional regulator, TetR family [Desulfotomaculum sp. 46_80]HAG09847.1 TetR/AcrR family transcriptional regulator [Desulfotomaculum sp.]HBY03878.1 TetR/AcrR family transcriptional regulator [Desulfotomaculum sp.]